MERFGYLVNEKGLTRRITEYKDLNQIIPLKITEEYKFRKDRLNKREEDAVTGNFQEYYNPGRFDQEKVFIK